MKQAGCVVLLTLTVLLFLTTLPVSYSAKKPVYGPRREDIKYIKCQVCEKLASELYHLVQKKQQSLPSPKKVTEYQIIEVAEDVCNLKKEEADWILKIDIVEQGDKLELVEQDVEGQCNAECKTIEQACQEVMGYSDTDVAEYIYTSKPGLDELVNYLCKDLTNACRRKPPPVPKDRAPGEPFVPKPSKEAEMEKIMRSMEGLPGAPGMKMYSREELMDMNNFGNEDADDEDDDEQSQFRANVKDILRKKESKKDDNWQQKISEGLKTTAQTVKRHADRVSNRIRQWWKVINDARAKKDSKTSSKTEL